MGPLSDSPPSQVGFYEVAPENWMGVGGKMGKAFRAFTEQHDFVSHGLSLSLGGPTPLDIEFLKRLKHFLDEHDMKLYSEHLSFCSDDGQLYDLLPMPITEEAIKHVVSRIKTVQDVLERRMAIENVSYYANPGQDMDEVDFINTILEEADCYLHLDVNNIYVNSINHKFNAEEFLLGLHGERTAYIHVAGHYVEIENELLIDTHGADVIDPVWSLLEKTYQRWGVIPTLLERDNDVPPMNELLGEIDIIAGYQKKWAQTSDSEGLIVKHA